MNQDSKIRANELNKSNASQEGNSSTTSKLPSAGQSKRNLSVQIFNGSDLKLYLLFKFGTYKRAGFAAGFTDERIHQICAGTDVPISPDTIKRLSEAWDINVVVLSGLFERLRLSEVRA